MKTGELALLGGEPVREKPYPVHTTIIDDEEKKEVLEVISGGQLSGFSGRAGERFLGGEKVKELEGDFCKRYGIRFAVTFNSATSALHGSISAAGIGPGDEVVTTPYTMSASASCVLHNNAIPIFADIDPETFCLDPESVKQRITHRTRAIMVVNLFGQPAELEELNRIAHEHNLILIEDNAQSPGAFYKEKLAGTIGQMGILSLNYHKTIQTGEGGVIITNNEDLANRLRLVRNHGEVVLDDLGINNMVNMLGWNYRMTELEAAIGKAQLRKLDFFNGHRQKLASVLTEALKEFDFLTTPSTRPGCTHVYYLYVLKFNETKLRIDRRTFAKALNAEGIPVDEGYVKPLYLMPMYQKRMAYGCDGCPFTCPYYSGRVNYDKGLCPVAERMYEKEVLTTNICRYPNTEEDVVDFARAVRKIVDNLDKLRAYAK
jgi:dTDP-4-amino-4,6-dideoxygalactose transaminase